MTRLTDDEIDQQMAKYFKKDSPKMLKFMLSQAAKNAVKANAETLTLSCDLNIGEDRYSAKVTIKVNKIGKKI